MAKKKPSKKMKASKAPKVPKKSKKIKKKAVSRKALDRRLLEIAAKQYSRLKRELAKGRKRLDQRIDDEKKIALLLGERIIKKARKVKETLLSK